MKPGERFNPFKLYRGSFLPEHVSRYRGLSPGAKVVYGRLCRFAGENGEVFPAVGTLGAETGFSASQARNYIQELEAQGFIEVDRENHCYYKGGGGGSNRYFLLYHAAFDGEIGERRRIPPLRKTVGVPLRKSKGVTPTENHTPTPTEDERPTPTEIRRQRESVEESQLKESHSSSGVLAIPVNDDDPFFSENGKPNPEDREALIEFAQDTLRASVASVRAGAEGISQVAALKVTKGPDKAIMVKILEAFRAFDDFPSWIADTENRRLANKARDPHAVYALYLADAGMRAEGIAEDRAKAERIAAEEQAAEEQRAAQQRARAEFLATALNPVAAVAATEGDGTKVAEVLARRLVRLGQPITPGEVITMARSYTPHLQCDGTGLLGWALDGTRRFCTCEIAEELQHEDPLRPAREIERAHSSLKGKLIAAALMTSGAHMADAIENSEIGETPETIVFVDVPKAYRLHFKDPAFSRVLSAAGEQRAVRLAWVAA